VDRKLKELGGTRAKQIACADEGTGLEDVVEPWKETVMDDLRKACLRKFANDFDQDNTNSNIEEKKEDEQDVPSETKADNTIAIDPEMESTKVESEGVEIINIIAQQHKITLKQHLSNFSLPSITASMSSCTLIDKINCDSNQEKIDNMTSVEEERRSIISGSSLSAGCLFNMQNPYSATILSARYLTNTSTNPLSKALLSWSTSPSDLSIALLEEISNTFNVSQNEKDAKRVIELTLNLPEDYSLEYEPGDSIGMLVSNEYTFAFKSIISTLQKQHQVDVKEQLIKVDENDPISIFDAIAKTVDITSIVKKRILARLAQLCQNEHDSNVLSFLSSKTAEGELLYKEFVEKYVLNIGHILALFPSCKPTVQDILGICDAMVPRYYSITSSPLFLKDKLTIAFSVVDYCIEDLPSGKQIIPSRRGGLATQYLEIQCASLLSSSTTQNPLQTSIPIFPKASDDFRLPKSLSTPLILVGPGTGVAPFLGFLSHRSCLMKEKKQMEAEAEQGTWRGGFEIEEKLNEVKLNPGSRPNNGNGAKSMLFFGCRWPDHDYLYKAELQQFLLNKTLTSLHSVFSRAPSQEGRKYVQHEMEAVGQDIVNLICNENASVYVCGDGNAMGKDVQDCLVSLLNKYGGDVVKGATNKIDDAGQVYMENMKKKNKFVLDIWS